MTTITVDSLCDISRNSYAIISDINIRLIKSLIFWEFRRVLFDDSANVASDAGKVNIKKSEISLDWHSHLNIQECPQKHQRKEKV